MNPEISTTSRGNRAPMLQGPAMDPGKVLHFEDCTLDQIRGSFADEVELSANRSA